MGAACWDAGGGLSCGKLRAGRIPPCLAAGERYHPRPRLPFPQGAPPSASMVKRALIACVLALGAPAWPAAAQEARAPEPQTLELMRRGFQKRLMEAALNPLKQQLTSLAELEKQRAAAGDYAAAIEARDQRKRLTTELERLDKELLLAQTREQSLKARLLPERVSLDLAHAELDGGVRMDGGALTGWSRPGAAAKWKLPDLPPGGYEVVVRHRCGPLEGGSLQVAEARFTLDADVVTTLRGPQEKNLGTLKVTDGSGPLVISARSVVKDNLMHLLAVHLTPAGR